MAWEIFRMHRVYSPPLLLLAGLLLGCAGPLGGGPNPADFAKPTIAVMKFENRASFPLGWDLGSGMRDVLVDRLVGTDRYHVIERPELDAIVSELHFQQSGLTRAQERSKLGQLKNVQYLVKGTLTDFTHVSASSGFFGGGAWTLFGSSNRAVMGMTLYVVDVESGEIVASESIQESVRASDLNVRAVYKDVAFGGSVFYRTPLGEATAHVIEKAVAKVTRTIAARPWTAKVAHLQPDGSVILNGGRDRGLTVGEEFDACLIGTPILDPDSGDLLGRAPGEPVGRLRVSDVQARYSVAAVVSGEAGKIEVGQACRKIAGR